MSTKKELAANAVNMGNLLGALTKNESAAPSVTEENRKAYQKARYATAGRKKKGSVPSVEVGLKDGETRATFIVDKDTVRKMKYIALMDATQLKVVVGNALDNYISAWENENGKIKIK